MYRRSLLLVVTKSFLSPLSSFLFIAYARALSQSLDLVYVLLFIGFLFIDYFKIFLFFIRGESDAFKRTVQYCDTVTFYHDKKHLI